MAKATAGQMTFEQIGYESDRERRVTRKEGKLRVLAETTCWDDLVAIVEPPGRGPEGAAGSRGRRSRC